MQCHAQLFHLCLTFCDPVDCSLPVSSVRGILQAKILEWVAMPSSRRSSRPRDPIHVSCIAGGFFTAVALRKKSIEMITIFLSFCKWGVTHWLSYKFWLILASLEFSSVQFSCSVVSNSLWCGLQHARPPCPSPTPGVYPNSCPLSWWCLCSLRQHIY